MAADRLPVGVQILHGAPHEQLVEYTDYLGEPAARPQAANRFFLVDWNIADMLRPAHVPEETIVRRRLLLALLVAGMGTNALWHASSQELPVAPPPRPWLSRRTVPPQLALIGAGSCSAAACHNAMDHVGFQGREYSLALARDASQPSQPVKDKHAQAYAVLFEPRAREMERMLHPDNPAARPETDALCLRCHAHPEFDTRQVRIVAGVPQFRLEDGVSCEVCHGPADRWVSQHFRGDGQYRTAADRLAAGQSDTRSLPGRIALCVDCHVGAPGMDVNHDLIAAGHPPLRFEFASFHALLHKHWDYAKDRDPAADARGRRDFEARAWALGRLATARSALTLLADRAESSTRDPRRPWPEFAEYDCAACHHDLREPSWRQAIGGQRKPGTLPPSRWYTAQFPDAFAGLGMPYDDTVREALTAVDTAMTTNRPDRRQVAATARHAAAVLDERIAQAAHGPAGLVAVDRVQRQLVHTAGDRAALTWEEGSQVYRALEAFERARKDMHLPDESEAALPRLRSLVQSPHTFSPTTMRDVLNALERK
jgi:hypothetical protein